MDINYGSSQAVQLAEQQLAAFESIEDSEVVQLVEKRRTEIKIISTTTTNIEVIKTELITRIEQANQTETMLKEKVSSEGIDSLVNEYQVRADRFID